MIYSKTLKQVWSIISSWQLDFIQSRLSDSCHCQLTRHDIIFSTGGQVSSHWPSLWQVIYVWVSLFIFPLPMLWYVSLHQIEYSALLDILSAKSSHFLRLAPFPLNQTSWQMHLPAQEGDCLSAIHIFRVRVFKKTRKKQMSESNLDISDCESWSPCTQTF